ncbi:mannitol-1-phosphate 5-dehydrogenase [Spiroplasma gladiatoris]|uniref:Mannitol-1-phosphate 5-dehydrogenase n=1 Tax=Spiroplasma gladiatoris TaxID=2143 RepID=A0A4P7AIJ5_9MOLU|nr:mannitol-1-phosphate 5-dehydrogenase [Spiroplasma gladiatoris]QBQ08107.1 mannitol-1-phosphate 5-dehydrogenase [Spiroplasma gladiatoris]
MNVVHFGAGNIGRGFIAPILIDSNQIKDFYFVDSNKQLIDSLKKNAQYKVIELNEESKTKVYKNFKALSSSEIDLIDKKIVSIITTSISSTNLKYIKDSVISIIKAKEAINQTLIIMCCENGEKVSSYFAQIIKQEYKYDNDLIKFIDVMVDRIVPNEKVLSLDVKVEPYFSWVVDNKNWPENISKIKGMTFTNNIDADICKKVWMLNGTHASLAWKEWQLSKFNNPIIVNVLNSKDKNELNDFLNNYLKEISNVIEVVFNYDKKELESFVEAVKKRFKNPFIKDEFVRVARNTIKKIQLDERIIKPLLLGIDNNLEVKFIKQSLRNALSYNNKEDEDGLKIQDFLDKNYTLQDIAKELIENVNADIIEKIL